MIVFQQLMFLSILLLVDCQVQRQAPVAVPVQSTRLTIGPNIKISSKFATFPLVEPHLSAHPSDRQQLLAAAMVVTDVNQPYQSCRLSSFYSSDGGQNWAETAHDYWGYDPWTAILENGQTAMSWLGTPSSFQHQFPIQFFSSADGGQHWAAPPKTFSSAHGHDGTKIAALGKDFYFTVVRFNGDGSADVVLYHRHGDAPFREVAHIPGQGVRLNFCEPAILSDGTVIVPASHFLQKIWVQRFDPKTQRLSEKHIVSIQPGGAKGYMRLAADTQRDSPFRDRLYFVRALGSRANFGGIWLNYSADGGRSWQKDIRVDQFGNNLPSKAQTPSVAVNKAGVVGISWVDSQHDPEQQKNDVYFTYSEDGGQHFHPPVRITSVSSDPRTAANGDVANKFPGGGHYLGLTARADGHFQLIWSDSRSGHFELQTCEVSIHSKG